MAAVPAAPGLLPGFDEPPSLLQAGAAAPSASNDANAQKGLMIAEGACNAGAPICKTRACFLVTGRPLAVRDPAPKRLAHKSFKAFLLTLRRVNGDWRGTRHRRLVHWQKTRMQARTLRLVQQLANRDDAAPRQTDAELAGRLARSELDAAAQLYDRYAGNVRGMVHRLLGPDLELDDVVQDVFVTAISSIHKLREPAFLKSWLLGIAVGKARGHLRARWRRRWLSFLPTDELPDRPEPARDSCFELAQEVAELLDSLRPEERFALLLCRVEGLSLEQGARACEMSLSTFKRRLTRGEERFAGGARRRPALSPWVAPSRGKQALERDRGRRTAQ
jgi:RNA polymerase sigma-70 factor (ECF subfamily)